MPGDLAGGWAQTLHAALPPDPSNPKTPHTVPRRWAAEQLPRSSSCQGNAAAAGGPGDGGVLCVLCPARSCPGATGSCISASGARGARCPEQRSGFHRDGGAGSFTLMWSRPSAGPRVCHSPKLQQSQEGGGLGPPGPHRSQQSVLAAQPAARESAVENGHQQPTLITWGVCGQARVTIRCGRPSQGRTGQAGECGGRGWGSRKKPPKLQGSQCCFSAPFLHSPRAASRTDLRAATSQVGDRSL